jgi:hypothetical protein
MGMPKIREDISNINVQLADMVTLINPTMTSSQIQNLLNQRGSFKFLKGEYNLSFIVGYTDHVCIDVKSDTSIIFEKGCILKCPTNSFDTYRVIRFDKVDNCQIDGAMVFGDRSTHTASTGEWGHGIAVLGGKNIIINNCSVYDCWGDGLDIWRSTDMTKMFSENITVNNFMANNNRRQGISVESVKGLRMKNLRLLNTNGTLPEAGLDLEPNGDYEFLEDIIVDNIYTKNNAKGIAIYLNNFASTDKYVSIIINNHTDEESDIPLMIKGQSTTGKLAGAIEINKPLWKKPVYNGCLIDWNTDNYARVKIDEPTIIDPNTIGGVVNENYSAIKLSSSVSLGKIDIIRPNIYSVEGFSAPSSFYISSGNNTIKDINIIDPIKLQSETRINVGTTKGVKVKDGNNILEYVMTYLNYTLTQQYHSLIHNEGMNTATEVLLDASIPIGGTPITIECRNALYDMLITPDANSKIVPLSNVNGQSIRFHNGTRITIQKISANTWQVINRVGWINGEVAP